jgi:hypothetical protein
MSADDPQDPQGPDEDAPVPQTATPSVGELLAAGAAARTLSTPPADEPRRDAA